MQKYLVLGVMMLMMTLSLDAQNLTFPENKPFFDFQKSKPVLFQNDPFFTAIHERQPGCMMMSASKPYVVNHLPGLFCKLEYKLECKSKLAPRIRLGSLQYTDWREGKTSAWRPPTY